MDPDYEGFTPMYGAPMGADADPAPGAAPPPFVSSNPVPTSTGPVAPLPSPAPAPSSTDAAAKRRAGIALVVAGTGVGAGALLGGIWGAGSGLLASGAALNAYRARQLFASDFADDRSEAIKRAVMSAVGIGLASYLGYRAHQARQKDD